MMRSRNGLRFRPGRKGRTQNGSIQKGAAYSEMLLTAPALILLGLGTVQTGLAWQGKTVVQYATFEAARAGAVHHGLEEPMRRELGLRLSPLYASTGTDDSDRRATALALQAAYDPALTKINVLSPGKEAFDDWGVQMSDQAPKAIPNVHLMHRDSQMTGPSSGLSIHEANILTIEVTHAVALRVPIVGKLITTLMRQLDPAREAVYALGRLPFTSRVSVRMQSEAWQPGSADNTRPDDANNAPDLDVSDPELPSGQGGGGAGGSEGDSRPPDIAPAEPCIDPHGLGSSPVLLTSLPTADAVCHEEFPPPGENNPTTPSEECL